MARGYRMGGGGGEPSSNILLSPLNKLEESETRWVQNSYIKGVGGGGGFNPSYGNVSISGDTATVTQTSGITVGFVTKCKENESYKINFTISGGTNATLRVQFYNGATMSSYVDLTSGDRTFTVPSGITDVVLNPRQNDNGTITFYLHSLVKV